MRKDLIEANMEFLKRVQLNGAEVPAFNALTAELDRLYEEAKNESTDNTVELAASNQ